MLTLYLSLIDDESSRSLFEQIYITHRDTMVYVAQRILKDQSLAEDATHDAFLRIINHLEKISDPFCHKTRSFVVLIVRNIAFDYYRKMKRLVENSYEEAEYLFEDPDLNPAELLEQKEDHELFRQRVAKLRPLYGEVLALKYSFEFSDKEIADLLGITRDTVRARLSRVRNQLRVEFDEEVTINEAFQDE